MISRFSKALNQALAAGRLLVTPNNRMARTLVRAHDVAQRAAGLSVWPTASVLPYAAFVERLWWQLSTVMPLPRRLNARVSRVLWSEIVERDAERAPLYATAGATALAQDTWHLMHLWRTADEMPWRSWRREGDGITYDTARFARWAARYYDRLADGGFIDEAQVSDFIARHASRLPGPERAWAMTGFDEHTPQALRLLTALRAVGFEVTEVPSLGEMEGSVFQYRARNAETELSDALSWAWQQVSRSNGEEGRQVAIVIPALNLQERAVRWQVEDRLPEPALCNVSLGEPLARKALVATALDVLTLFDRPLPAERVAALLQSPYLSGDVLRRAKRAALARRWLGIGQREVSWNEMLRALATVDPALSARWREAAPLLPAQVATGAWPHHVLRWWQALGWPGSQTLDSVDYQVRDAWMRCLEALPTLEAVRPRMPRRELAQTLQQWAAEALFQPEGSDMPIQILGTLEAAGLPFDALWVAGLDGDAWPPPVEPQPLLPPAWQRTCGMPRATVEQTLSHAGRVQAQWQQMAPEVVMSSPAERDGQPTTVSPLLASLPPYRSAIAPLRSRMERLPVVEAETLDDDWAPPVARDAKGGVVEAMRHGSSVLAQQSDCPFKAFAGARLQVTAWPESSDGLSPIERGNLVHAVLQKLWEGMGSQAALLALGAGALDARIDAAYQEAVAEEMEKRQRWRHLPPAIVAMEKAHVTALLRAWCEIEKERAPFQVTHTEKDLTLELAGMRYTLRADRIDMLEDGGVVLIDYKTGRPESTKSWFETRPSPVQLGIYALAWRASMAPAPATLPVRAVVYAHLREKGPEVRGMVGDAAPWPKLDTVARFGFETMAAAQQRWREIFTALTEAFLAGDARVLPRHKNVCQTCDLKPLCRIGVPADDEEEGDEASGEESERGNGDA